MGPDKTAHIRLREEVWKAHLCPFAWLVMISPCLINIEHIGDTDLGTCPTMTASVEIFYFTATT